MFAEMRTIFGAMLSLVLITASTAKPIPAGIYERIARASLSNHPTQKQIAKRLTQVKTWMESQGGDTWYANYQKHFGIPSEPRQLFVAETKGLDSPTLGYYYLHQPLTDGPDIVWYYCQSTGLPDHSPTIRAFCALSNWNAFLLTNEKKYRDAFLKFADDATAHAVNGQFQWHKNVPARGMRSPWISGLTQSLYVSLLLRAYQTTHDGKYLDVAKEAFSWISTPANKGGVYMIDRHGTWFEEYPNTTNPSHVLNGHIWALFGIWDYYRVTHNPKALAMFSAGIRVVKAEINRYDAGYWCVYAQTNDVDMVIGSYMQFIVQQMKVLHAITGDPFFMHISDKWGHDQEDDAYFVHIAATQYLAANKIRKDK